MPIKYFREHFTLMERNIVLALRKESNVWIKAIELGLDFFKKELEFKKTSILLNAKMEAAKVRTAALDEGKVKLTELKSLDEVFEEVELACAVQSKDIDHDIDIIEKACVAVKELTDIMEQFYRKQSKENALILLQALASKGELLNTLAAELVGKALVVKLNELKVGYDRTHKDIKIKLEDIINKYNGNLGLYGYAAHMVTKKLERNLYRNQLVRDHIIVSFNQIDNPVINSIGGYCFGIGLGISHDLLSIRSADGLPTVKQLAENALSDIAMYQNAYCSRERKLLAEGGANEIVEKERQAVTPYLQLFVDNYDGNRMSAIGFANHIAKKIGIVFSDIKENEDYAIELSMDPNHADGLGHSMAVVHAKNRFYFVDANSGIYSFDNIKQLENFLPWYLNTMSYTTLFSKFSLNNFPQLEESFPIPDSMKSKAISGRLLSAKIDSGNIAYYTDKAYQARVTASAICEVTFGLVVDSVAKLKPW